MIIILNPNKTYHRKKQILYDENGNITKDFCVNWRIHQEVMRELKIELV